MIMLALTLRSSSLRSRSLPFAALAVRVVPHTTYSAHRLRSLERNELIDTFLVERNDWLQRLMTVKGQAFERESKLKDQAFDNENKLKDRLLVAEGRSNATEAKRNEASEARLKSEMELKFTKMQMRELQIALLRSQNRFNLRGMF